MREGVDDVSIFFASKSRLHVLTVVHQVTNMDVDKSNGRIVGMSMRVSIYERT